MKKRNVLLFVLAASTLGLSSCGETDVLPESIKISAEGNATSISVGETLNFEATVLPEGAIQEVVWSVVEITGEATITTAGVLTATKEGTVEVMATSYLDSDVRGTYSLKIEKAKDIAPTSLKVVSSETEINIDGTATLSVQVTPENASTSVTWSSLNQDIATVSATGVVKGISAGEATIKATSTVDTNVSATIKITVNEESEVEPTYDYENMAFTTHDDWVNGENDTPLKFKGKVAHITESSKGTYNCWVMNGSEGYYLWGLDEEKQVLELGKSYEIGGIRYQHTDGTFEVKNIEYIKEISETFDITVTDITDKKPNVLDNIKPYLGGMVEVKQVATSEISVSDTKAYNVVVDVKEDDFTIRIDPSVCGDDEFAKINDKLRNLPTGYLIDAKGIMHAYGYGGAKPQLYVVKADDLVVPELSDADKIQLAVGAVTLPNCVAADATKIDLPTSVEGYDVTISWATTSEYFDNNGTKLSTPDRTTDAKFTATFTLNSEVVQKDYFVTVIGNEELETVHTFNLEDADPENNYGNSVTKPSYAEGKVTLGNPQATWNLKNCLISSTDSDAHDGIYGLRIQSNKSADKTGQVELQTDFEFTTVDFDFATYGGDVFGGTLIPKYSIDGGETWKTLNKEYVSNSRTLETIRVVIPETSTTMRFQLTFKENTGKRLNLDNFVFYK